MPKIAISYRRTESDATGRIYDRLVQRYGEESIFRDIDFIPLGVDFRKAVDEALGDADVLIAIVGPQWRGTNEQRSPRIMEENDLVRIEIETVLKRDVPLIPVLIGGAIMPKATELPESIRDFSYRNAATIDSGRNFNTDVERLMRSIDRHMEGKERSGSEQDRKDLLKEEAEKRRRAEEENRRVEGERIETAGSVQSRKGDPRSVGAEKTLFVSYPKDIAPAVMNRVVSTLIGRGFRVWLYDPSPFGFSADELVKIPLQTGGGPFLNQTLDAIRAADAVLFLISPWTLKSKFQNNELSVALASGRIVPCIVDDALGFDQLPAGLRELHVRELTEPMLDTIEGATRLQMLITDLDSIATGGRAGSVALEARERARNEAEHKAREQHEAEERAKIEAEEKERQRVAEENRRRQEAQAKRRAEEEAKRKNAGGNPAQTGTGAFMQIVGAALIVFGLILGFLQYTGRLDFIYQDTLCFGEFGTAEGCVGYFLRLIMPFMALISIGGGSSFSKLARINVR